MKYVRFIFGGKVLKSKRHLTYFQFLIYKKIIKSSLEDLNCACVINLAQKQAKKIGWMINYFLCSLYHLDFGHHCILGIIVMYLM